MSGVAEHDVEATDEYDRADVDYGAIDLGSPTRVGGEDHHEATATVDGEDRPVRVTRPRLQGRLDEAADRYLEGATEWASVAHHDGVLSILDWGTDDDGVPWVVADRPGETLRDRIDEGVDPETAVRIAESCAQTLQSVHEHLVYHRALVPERILFDGAAGDDPVIADVGTARALDESAGSFESLSTAYAAPEQFDRERFHPLPESGADQRIDVYRLGAVLYEALTGRRPYPETGTDLVERVTDPDDDPAAPSEHAEDLPEGTDDVVLRAISTHPGDRYWTADEFAAALAGLLGEGDRYPDRRWTQSGAGAHHRARVVDEGPDPDEEFQSDWIQRVNPSAHDPDPEADAAVVDGDAVYYVDHDPGSIVRADAETGTERWRYHLDSVNDGLAVVDGVVCATSTLQVKGIDAESGEELWSFESDKSEEDIDDPEKLTEGGFTRTFHHAPVVADGSFLVGCDDHFLYRFDPESGAIEWEFQAYYWIRRAPAVSGDTVYVGTHRGTLHAVDLETGEQRWEVLHDTVEDRERGTGDTGPITVGYDRVFLEHDEELQVLDADTGDRLWDAGYAETPEEVSVHPSSPALGGGLVIAGSEKDGLIAYDPATGDRLWNARVEYEAGESSGSVHGDCWEMFKPALGDGVAYVGCARRNLYAVDCDTGEFLREFDGAEDGVGTPVTLAGDAAYYTTAENLIERVSPATVDEDENVFDM